MELTGVTIKIGQDDQYSGSGADNNLEKEAADTLLAEEDEVPANTDTEAAEPAEDEASDKVTDP